MKLKKIFCAGMTFTLLAASGSGLNVWAAQGSLDNFKTIHTYVQGKFADIEGQWYYESVKNVYEKDVIAGMSENAFQPEGKLRVSEAITLAAKINDIYENGQVTIVPGGDTWYAPYVAYAVSNGIVSAGEFSTTMEQYATRAEMAHIFAKALPENELLPKAGNVVDSIPDVDRNHTYGSDIYTLYAAGVLAGSGSDGSFSPDSDITRGEASAIISRIINVAERVEVKLNGAPPAAVADTGGDYVIQWSDKVLEQAARSLLEKTSGDIKASELDFITELSFSYGSMVYFNDDMVSIRGVLSDDYVKDVADLAHFRNVEDLSFNYTTGTSFANMPALDSLTSLSVYISGEVTGLSGLAQLKNLKKLNLYATESNDFSFLATMTSLEELDVARTGIRDLTPIAGLTNLKVLKIYGNECDAAPIAHLTGLQEVTVSNQVKNKELLQFVPGYSNFNVSVNMGGR